MVTLLDAHSSIAMSYEFYPTLLIDAETVDIEQVISVLNTTSDLKSAAKKMPTKGLENLVKRAPRARLTNSDLGRLLRDHLASGRTFTDPGDRLRFIEHCGLHNMQSARKSIWGAKCGTNFDDYLSLWPQAKFINVIRDGRDVLASQLNTGAFDADPASIGRSWTKNHTRFRRMIQSGQMDGYEVIYERLIADPAGEAKSIFSFLGIPFEDAVLDFHAQDLNIYAVGHMSKPALVKPINSSMVGRWKRDLSDAQVREFMGEAGEAMREFGYE